MSYPSAVFRTHCANYCANGCCGNRTIGLHFFIMFALGFFCLFTLPGFAVTVISALPPMFPFPLITAFLFLSFGIHWIFIFAAARVPRARASIAQGIMLSTLSRKDAGASRLIFEPVSVFRSR